MTIHFHCGCGQKLKASADSVGKHFECPVCGTAVIVPEHDEATPEARKPVAASVAAGESHQSAAEVQTSAVRDKRAAAPPSDPVAKPTPNHRQQPPSKGGKNGAKHKAKPPSDEDLALEALGLGSGNASGLDTRSIAESDTKIIAESDTKELDKPIEHPREIRNGFIPESQTRLRSDDEILAERMRMIGARSASAPRRTRPGSFDGRHRARLVQARAEDEEVGPARRARQEET